jgi:hypothetical protein
MQNHGDISRPISGEEFARRATGSNIHPLESELLFASAEGLGPNLARQLTFAGCPFPCELQVLGYRRHPSDSYEHARAAHAVGLESALALAIESESWISSGCYLLPAALRPGVETRMALPGKWFDQQKGKGTTDSDIEARLVFAIDFDVKRPASTSATSSEMLASARVATRAWEYLYGVLGGASSLAYVHSGNGRQIHVALDRLSPEESRTTIAAILIGLDAIFSTTDVVVDRKLFDAKRILPACGTTKRKGAAGSMERPHRQTAIVAPASPKALSFDELRELARQIWRDTTHESRKEMEEVQGIRPTLAVFAPSSDSPYARANAVSPIEVAEWIGVVDLEGHPTCPGCGSTSGIAVLNHGFKCSHNRCSSKGRAGFRTNVDLVAECKGIPPHEAVARLSERFSLHLPPVAPEAVPLVSLAPTGGPTTPIAAARLLSVDESWLKVTPEPRQYLAVDTRTGHGALDSRGVSMLVAAGGVGKSYATIALALAVATGSLWLGTFSPREPGRVLLASAEESAEEIRRRMFYVARSTGIPTIATGAIDILDLHDVQVPLLDAESRMTEHAAGLVSVARERGPYALVILDPLSRLAGAPIDSDNIAAGLLVSALEAISSAAQGLVFVVHHTDKAARRAGIVDATAVRGASGLGDSARMVMLLTSEHVSDVEVVLLARVKANHVPRWAPLPLRRGGHGELLPMSADDLAILADLRSGGTKSGQDRRSQERKAREVEQLTETQQRASSREQEALERRAAEDAAALAIEEEMGSSITYRVFCAEMRARLGGCSKERAEDARARIKKHTNGTS